MDSTVVIRLMTQNDVEAVVAIYDRIYTPAYISFGELASGLAIAPDKPAPDAIQIFREEVTGLTEASQGGLFVAELDGQVVGFALASINPVSGHSECWLNDLGVDPEYQGRGCGRQLIEAVLAFGAAGNARYFLLESGIKNESAHHAFERMGFHPMAMVFYKSA